MRTTFSALFLGGAIGLALLGGCGSNEVTLAADAGVVDPGPADASAAEDFAGRDLAGLDLASGTIPTRDMASGDMASTPSGNPESDPKLQGITALHNQARAAVMPQPTTALPPLTWNTTVAAAAQKVADTCSFQHSGNGYGENIYASQGSTPTPASAVNQWVGEKANYTYASNTCASGKSCGHYTQVVWRGSLRLGCAQKTCTGATGNPFMNSMPWDFWVCDYDPAGNVVGQKPY